MPGARVLENRTHGVILQMLCFALTVLGQAGDTDTTAQDEVAATDTVEERVQSLDRMVVTATRTKRRISETPASVSVVVREEISSAPAKNIDDLVMSKPSVQVKRIVGMGEGIPSDIIMRGIPGPFGSSRTLVLVDGIPTNVSGTPYLVLAEVPLDAVESIEIVRGPYSSLYGANAFGGVVNVLTREGDGRPGVEGCFETTYPFSTLREYGNGHDMRTSLSKGGKASLWNLGLTTSGGNSKVNYLASGGYRTIGNYLLNDSVFVRRIRGGGLPDTTYHKKAVNYDYRDTRFFGKFGIGLGDRGNVTVHMRYFNSDLGFGKTKNAPDTSNVTMKGERFLVGPVCRISLTDNVDLRVATYVRRLIGEYWNEEKLLGQSEFVPTYWQSISEDWLVETQALFRLGRSQVLTVGAEYLVNRIDFGATVDSRTMARLPGKKGVQDGITNIGVYLQDEIGLFDRLNVVPGVRLDYDLRFGAAVSPKLGISCAITEQIRARSSVGRAFRSPTLTELFMPDLTVSDYLLVSNPDLEPEYIWAVDGGVEFMPTRALRIETGMFYNKMEDLVGLTVDESTLGESVKHVTHGNMSSAWSRGVELDVEWQALDWLNVGGNYVLQDSRDEEATSVRAFFGEEDTVVELDYVPGHSATFGLRVRKELGKSALLASLSQSLVGRRSYLEWTQVPYDRDFVCLKPVDDGFVVVIKAPRVSLPSYWRTDLSLTCQINAHLSVGLNVQNLWNAQYEESGGAIAPGRFATLVLRGGI